MKNNFLQAVIIILCGFILIEKVSNNEASASDLNIADKPFLSMGIGADYASGDFGTATTTDFISIPLIIDLYPSDRLDFEISIPFVYQNNSDNFYSSSGNGYQYHGSGMTPGVRQGKSKQDNSATQSSDKNPGSSFSDENTQTSPSNKSVSGLGDVTISAGYSCIEEGVFFPQIKLTGLLKIPTADSDEGLGSGSLDWGPGIGISKWLGKWLLFAQVRYIFCGSSDSYESEDHFTQEADIGYQFTDSFYGAISAFGATESYEDADTPLEGRLKFRWNFTQKTMLETYILKGFSDGSPDSGAGLAIFHNF